MEMMEAVEQLKQKATETQEPEIAETETQEAAEQAEQPQEFQSEDSVLTSSSEEPDVEADDGAERIELEADQFAELLNLKSDLLDITDDGKVMFKAKVGDEPVDVNLEQLLNAYQGDANLTNRSKQLADMEKTKQTELSSLQAQVQQFAQQSSALLDGLKTQYLKPFEDINWQQLKADDPGEYAAQMQDKRNTEETLTRIAQDALSQINEAQQLSDNELKTQYSNYAKTQEDMLMDSKSPLHIPSLEKTYPDIKSYMGTLGFTDVEQNQLVDARLLNALYKSMMFDKGKAGAKQKLSKPLPKILKGGKPPSKQDFNLEQQAKMKDKLKESGSMNDAVALLRSRRK